MKPPHTEIPEKNKESFVRLISMFEVKRPKKSPNSTMKKAKSVSSLTTAISSDEDVTKCNMELASTKHCSLSRDRNKRRTKSTRSTHREDYCDNKIKHIIDDIERSSKLVEDFGEKLRSKRQQKDDCIARSDSYQNDNIERYQQFRNSNGSGTESLDRRYFKNGGKKTFTYDIPDAPCKELISRKRNRKKCISVSEVKSENEADYAKTLVNELELAMEKLKVYQLLDEVECTVQNSTEDNEHKSFNKVTDQINSEEKLSKSTWAERLNIRRESIHLIENSSDCSPRLSEVSAEDILERRDTLVDISVNCNERVYENLSYNNTAYSYASDDEFGECLAEDLEENGSYFVEAFNDDGRELIIVEIAVERRAIDLNSLETINESIENSDIVFHQNDDNSLNVIDDPKKFVSAESVSSGFITGPKSARSTLYSTASRDSEVFDTDEEEYDYIQREKNGEMDTYNNYRRETFCDNKGIIRIERIGYPEIRVGDDLTEIHSTVSRSESHKGTLSYIIDEIKTTERKYLEDLNRVVTKYMPYIEEHTPPNLIGRQCYIFGNIDKLYHKQKEFLVALENCGNTVNDVVRTFIDFERLFKLYPRYFKNKPKADIVLKEFSHIIRQSQTEFEERLDLSSYLLTPLQRLGKYKLFLENIEKQLRKLSQPIGSVEMALDIIKREMSKGNDFVAIESIENSPINKDDYGSFKMREKFNILKPRRLETMVFLFENIIVFTISDQRNMDSYNYFHSIKMVDLRIATFEDLTIHLTDFTLSKRISRADRFTYVLEAKTEKIRETWRKAIEDILWQQLLKAKENTLKMYQTSGTTKKKKAARKLVKSTGSSTFYVE